MLRTTVAILAALTLGGCAAPFKVEKLQEFTPQSNTFVLLSTTQWDAKLRTELSKKGFKILKFASQNKVISDGKEGEIARTFNEAEARYGITFTWQGRDSCPYNSSQWIIGSFEVSDINTNEVLLVIEMNEWTEPCAFRGGMGFKDLAETFAKVWRK